MTTITKRQGKYKGIYPVYTVEEAASEGIEPVYWRDAKEGDYVQSDDDYVQICLSAKRYGKENQKQIVCPAGRRWEGSESFLVGPHLAGEVPMYATSLAHDSQENEARKSRTKRAIQLYVEKLLRGREIDWREIGMVYRPDDPKPHVGAKRLFKNPKVIEAVDAEIRRAFEKEGIDDQWVVERLKRATELAEEGEDIPSMIRAVSQLGKYRGMEARTRTSRGLGAGIVDAEYEIDEESYLPPAEDHRLPEHDE